MDSMNLKEAKRKAQEIDKTLTAHDFGKYFIEFLHEDETHAMIDSAIYKELDDEWIAIFAEHHETLVYHKEDLKWVKQWKQPEIKYWSKS